MFLNVKKRRNFPSTRIPSFRFWTAPMGTAYLVQSRGEPWLFKVGLTTCKTTERRSELNRVAGDDMRIVQTVQLPWAAHCEATLLRRLRLNPLRRRDRRGTEWFSFGKKEPIDKIAVKLRAAARYTKLIARLNLSWPKDG